MAVELFDDPGVRVTVDVEMAEPANETVTLTEPVGAPVPDTVIVMASAVPTTAGVVAAEIDVLVLLVTTVTVVVPVEVEKTVSPE